MSNNERRTQLLALLDAILGEVTRRPYDTRSWGTIDTLALQARDLITDDPALLSGEEPAPVRYDSPEREEMERAMGPHYIPPGGIVLAAERAGADHPSCSPEEIARVHEDGFCWCGAWHRADHPHEPSPREFERPFAEAVARVAIATMEKYAMRLVGRYSGEPVYPEAFVQAVATEWENGRPARAGRAPQ